jgi:N-dimethylarginine dimethylaminohydrolase
MRVGTVEPERAVRQHCALVGRLRALGAEVDVVPFVHAAYDSVFAKDSAALTSREGVDRALMAHPHHRVRRAEQLARCAALEERGFAITPAPASTLEGGDVVVHAGYGESPARGYLGHGFRSSRESIGAVERFFGIPFTPLELRDPTLYHLDMALAVLGRTTFVCEEALTPRSMRDLLHAAGTDAIVRVSAAEARRFALNFIALDGDVVLAQGARSFEERLRVLGYTTHALPLSEFQLAGGSAACLVARVHAMGKVAVRTTAAMRSTAA